MHDPCGIIQVLVSGFVSMIDASGCAGPGATRPLNRPEAEIRGDFAPARMHEPEATWRSGDAADCKSAYPGSIPGVASIFFQTDQTLDRVADAPDALLCASCRPPAPQAAPTLPELSIPNLQSSQGTPSGPFMVACAFYSSVE